MSYTYDYPHPAVTADIVIFSIRDEELHVLLIQRKLNPFKGAWALPGGFIQMDEDLETGAARELAEETGLTGIHLEQLGAFGRPDRDPRERVITIAFLALVPSDKLVLSAATDASDAQWHNLSDLPKLAFDHENILNAGRERLANMVSSDIAQSARVVFKFLPGKFTLAQAQSVFEIIKGEALDKRNFRKWIMANWALTDLEEKTQGGRHRPAALYSLT
ncbi:NUDIX domain-containing protein [Pseudohalocynthiibacter aestuariivivens]|jgi:ADP-ribose pyrophosphatase YjhB (NUDIX family)|uniref:NUDIX domain-containing protein n=1 Tax=Pseudohalocynthiibacter aestuariivivens TaxID=1591409 RepID=A0ABV5JB24_9RHOB|nr:MULTISPECIES: NUDIX domain-containing protein [Pseudohalocynthiibacter]MBS9715806.1 NUDIX hydrolase [Pseudohalocynthiibacter aestuariivivens]MCK0101419.1 NUDIX hydrolase [Pseudohalocynthiibacter sp. F2068]